MSTPVTAVEVSANSKIGKVSSTYVSQATCPSTCPWYNAGCYSESGFMALTTRRLNKSEETNVDLIAGIESDLIKKLTGKNPLRLHVVGDTTTVIGARLLRDACKVYSSKHNQPIWTYTHCHTVRRREWGEISVLRSCETLNQVKKAHKAGYASAMVIEEFKDTKVYDLEDGFRGLPCPNQTKGVTCSECKLCMNDKYLHKNKLVILFSAHSAGKGKMIKQLNVINGK